MVPVVVRVPYAVYVAVPTLLPVEPVIIRIEPSWSACR